MISPDLIRENAEQLFAASPAVICFVSLEHELLYINRDCENDAKSPVGSPLYDLVRPAYRKSLKENIDKSTNGGEVSILELQTIKSYGSKWYRVQIGPMRSKGKIRGATISALDISDKKQIKRSRFIKEVVKVLPGLLFEYDPNHDCIVWGGNIEDIFGSSAGKIADMEHAELLGLIHPKDRDQAIRALSRLQYKNRMQHTCRLKLKQEYVHILMTVVSAQNEDGKPYLTGMLQDISGQVLREVELEQSKVRLQEILKKKVEEEKLYVRYMPHEKLSASEIKVFDKIIRGRNEIQAAKELKMSRQKVWVFRKRIFDKLQVRNIQEVVDYAVAHKLI